MNPHRLTWSFAYSFPFAQLTAIATLIGLLLSREPKRIPWVPITVIWLLLVLWMSLTTIFAIDTAHSLLEWGRTMKIQLMCFLTLMLMGARDRLNLLVWTIVVSLGFYGLKGGVFSILTGGEYRVFGPPESFIQDNNTMALALIMILPLMRYLQLEASRRVIRWALALAMILTALSILTSQSRGAFLALAVMSIVLIFKSPYRVKLGLAIALVIPMFLIFMPERWFERMQTIEEYSQDRSAMGRINAWWFAYNLASDRPIFGGGFDTFTPDLFLKYAPDPYLYQDSHSIYFEMLAEHGFVGLALFLLLGVFALRVGSWISKNTKGRDDLSWARNLASMLQTGLIGYAVGGAFLGLAYFDLYYQMVAIMILTKCLVQASTSVSTHAIRATPSEPKHKSSFAAS
jgi:probable O-glycosylation ligase (exosortase A-associated)